MDFNKYLNDKGVSCEAFDTNDGRIAVQIDWGDWKHEHGYCDYLMKEKGYLLVNEEVTEENGSDCYSSIHYYEKITLK